NDKRINKKEQKPVDTRQIIDELNDDDLNRQLKAIETIEEFKIEEAAIPLIDLIKNIDFDNGSKKLARSAANALSQVGWPEDGSISIAIHEYFKGGLLWTLIAHAKMDSKEAYDMLMLLTKVWDEDLLIEIIRALGEIGNIQCIPRLIDLLLFDEPDDIDFLRFNEVTSKAIIQIGEPAVMHIVNALGSPSLSEDQQLQLIQILGELKSPESVPHLTPLLNDINGEIRIFTVYALQQINDT
ncbi:MAG: hypothetical protein IIA68_03195, partial [Proteobacteria bacterium]|nr:hypothetical protein [Pseudomonadota bacterium]